MSLRNKIINAKDFTLSPVSIPEWGEEGDFFIKSMKLREQRVIMAMLENNTDKLEIAATSIIHSLCDKDGTLILEEGDIEALLDKSASICNYLMAEINRINRTDEDAVEEATKN